MAAGAEKPGENPRQAVNTQPVFIGFSGEIAHGDFIPQKHNKGMREQKSKGKKKQNLVEPPKTKRSQSMRDDFTDKIKRNLEKRVNSRCSNLDCRASTSGPQTDTSKAMNVGVAAHITAAAPNGPRYNPALTSKARADITNGIWLCQNCAKMVDNDPGRFTADILREWKLKAEEEASEAIGRTARRPDEGHMVVDKWVSLQYIEKSGRIDELKKQGYDCQWVNANHESEKIDLEGWEPVLVDQPDGNRVRLKIRDHPVVGGYLILLKRRRP